LRQSHPAFAVNQFDLPGKTETYEILRWPQGHPSRRLILLTAGNEPKLAELFARAELKWGGCAASAPSTPPADWATDAENPRLRGTI
jgi:hypothetical protein